MESCGNILVYLLNDNFNGAVGTFNFQVTAFVLLTGTKPFPKARNNDLFVDDTYQMEHEKSDAFPEYDVLMTTVNYPSYMSMQSIDFIASMLIVDSNRRLSAGPNGVSEMKKHPFFSSIDWDLLVNKRLVPSYIPPPKSSGAGPHIETFENTMRDIGLSDWMNHRPGAEVQKYFQKW